MVNIPAGGWINQPAAQPYLPDIYANTPPGWTPDQFANQIGQESGFRTGAVGPTVTVGGVTQNAQGIAQILPTTAANPGYGLDPIDLNSATTSQQIAFAGKYDAAVGVGQYSGGGYNLAQLTTPGVTGANGTSVSNQGGQFVTTNPDGSQTVTDPDTGITSTINPSGTTTGVQSAAGTAASTVANAVTGAVGGAITEYFTRTVVVIFGLILIVGAIVYLKGPAVVKAVA